MKFLLTANEAAGTHAFRLLQKSDHEITGLITPNENTALIKMAEAEDIPVLKPHLLRDADFSDWLVENEIDVLLNVHLLEIIHSKIIEVLRVGGFNLHPGPLPRYAGLNTPSWAIYNGESDHGVTLHWLYPDVDTGPIAYQSIFPIKPNDTGLTLSSRCTMEGMKLITELLDQLSNSPDAIPEITQNLDNRTYYLRNDIPLNGKIDWEKTAAEIDRFVRACNYGPFRSPWGHPTTAVGKKEVEILSVNISSMPSERKPESVHIDPDRKVMIAASDLYVEILTCKSEGKPADPSTVFMSDNISVS